MADPCRLTADDKAQLAAILAECPELAALRAHVACFADLMTQRRGRDLEKWMTAADASGLPELRSFTTGDGHYRHTLAGVGRRRICTSTGLALATQGGLRLLEQADTIVVPGYDDVHRRPPDPLLRALREAARRGVRLVSICTGAFTLAWAGLLDGRPVTTHWLVCEVLVQMFPGVRVDPGVLYVDDGDVLTSAGVAAGLDLCLHVVRKDHGAAVAAEIARRTVVAPHRDGGQAQFIHHRLSPAWR